MVQTFKIVHMKIREIHLNHKFVEDLVVRIIGTDDNFAAKWGTDVYREFYYFSSLPIDQSFIPAILATFTSGKDYTCI